MDTKLVSKYINTLEIFLKKENKRKTIGKQK